MFHAKEKIASLLELIVKAKKELKVLLVCSSFIVVFTSIFRSSSVFTNISEYCRFG